MKLYRPEDRLPPDNTYVLIHTTRGTWCDSHDQAGCVWRVAKFRRGISQAERDALPDGNERKRIHRSEDEGFNNRRAYYWDEFGPDGFFGQDVDLWAHLPPTP